MALDTACASQPGASAGAEPTSSRTQEDAARPLRKDYRKLEADVKRKTEDLGDPTKPELLTMLQRGNSLHRQVKRPREQAKDAEVFAELAERGLEQGRRVRTGSKSRTPADVVRALKVRFAGGADEDLAANPEGFAWMRLYAHCARWYQSAPGTSCMLGTLEVQPRQRPQTQGQRAAKRKPPGPAERPEEVQTAGEMEQQETDRVLEQMWAVLKARQSVGFLELVLNPASFTQTVENIFTLSFLVADHDTLLMDCNCLVRAKARLGVLGMQALGVHALPRTADDAVLTVRDSKVRFTRDAAQGMLVSSIVDQDGRQRQQQQQTSEERTRERMQFMLSYSQADWLHWRQHLTPEQCLVAHRAEAGAAAGQTPTDGAGRSSDG